MDVFDLNYGIQSSFSAMNHYHYTFIKYVKSEFFSCKLSGGVVTKSHWLRSIHVYEFTVPVRTVSYNTPDCDSNRMRSYFCAYPSGGACVFNVFFGHQSPRACSAPGGLSQNHPTMQIKLVT